MHPFMEASESGHVTLSSLLPFYRAGPGVGPLEHGSHVESK